MNDSQLTELTQPSVSTPMRVYESRHALYSKNHLQLGHAVRRFAWARVIMFSVALLAGWLSLAETLFTPYWSLIPATFFLGFVILHAHAIKQLKRLHRAIDYHAQRLKHCKGEWIGLSDKGSRYIDSDHPYSIDLDIFGDGSLFEFINGARTRLGEDTLAQWFCSGAEAETIKRRQAAIEELRNQIDFREQLALLEAEARSEFDQKFLQKWAESQAQPFKLWQRITAAVLGISAALSLLTWALGYGSSPFLIVVIAEILFYTTNFRKIKQITLETDAANSGLAILSQVLNLLEQQKFETSLLRDLRKNLDVENHPPSWQVARLRKLIEALNNCLRNQFFGPVAFILGLPIHIAHRIESWRELVGPHIPTWFNTVGQIEALNSLARYAFENPDNPFPEIIPESDKPVFEASALGHPLISRESRIPNDIDINDHQRLIMVSGSNMSGKSTLLRTIGINIVLALCGAPVCAKQLKTTRFQLGSAMRADDSLQQGASLFYAVISRIKNIVALAGKTPPLLFLLDEILQGTNSHDRRVGAEGIIKQLIEQNAVGLVTTHDLALTAIVDSLDDQAINIHFQDHLADGKMVFDYKICSGVVQKSNALELMRMIGLDVGNEPSD